MNCLLVQISSWKVSCSALNMHSTTPARAHSWTFQEHGGRRGVTNRSSNREEQTGGGGGEGIGTWILGSQFNWFRLVPPQEFICPLLDHTPCPVIWEKSGISKEEGSFKEVEKLLKKMEAKMTSYNIIKMAA